MEPQFVDRLLACSDCHSDFIFTAGEQLFFHDKDFKNDPKRCKPCKSRRSGLAAAASGAGPAAAGLSRTETRTECSECGVETTVPFKPTQGRPVLCRQCFQAKGKAAAVRPAIAFAELIAEPLPPTLHALSPHGFGTSTAVALSDLSAEAGGATLSADAAVVAAASMAAASPQSSVASAADLASITPAATLHEPGESLLPPVLATAMSTETRMPELQALAADAPEA